MPIYEYRCENGHQFEVIQSMADDSVEACEQCGAPVERVFHPVAVHFKGSGFYTTDYKDKGKPGGGKDGDSGSSGDGKSDSGGDSKSDSGGDSKSDSGGDSKSDSKSDSGSKSDSKSYSGSKSDSKPKAKSSSD
jgi:putative FmdB family regulatory protein